MARPSHLPDEAAATALPPAAARRLRQRLLERVADDEATHLTISADQGPWQPFLAGVVIKVLHQHQGVMSCLLRLAPGASLPAHRHRLDEECLVLAGVLRVGRRLQLGAGGYHLAHRGALHARLSTATGALLFLRGAVPRDDDVLA